MALTEKAALQLL